MSEQANLSIEFETEELCTRAYKLLVKEEGIKELITSIGKTISGDGNSYEDYCIFNSSVPTLLSKSGYRFEGVAKYISLATDNKQEEWFEGNEAGLQYLDKHTCSGCHELYSSNKAIHIMSDSDEWYCVKCARKWFIEVIESDMLEIDESEKEEIIPNGLNLEELDLRELGNKYINVENIVYGADIDIVFPKKL